MRIRTLFLICMLTVAAMAAAVGGWMLVRTVIDYRLAGRVERSVDIDAQLFRAIDKIAAERPVVGNALLDDAPADASLRARLASLRQNSDSALARLEQRLGSLPDAGPQRQLAVVRKARADLITWRTAADAALILPKTERDPNIFTRYIIGLNDLFEGLKAVLDIGDMSASLHDGVTVELMALSRYVWNVRATMGVRTVPLMAAIDRGAVLSPDLLEAQAAYDGILNANWGPIDTLAIRLSGVPNLAATIASARPAYDQFEKLCLDVIAAGRNSTDYPISALDLGRHVARTAPWLLRIRDEALAAAAARVVETRERAAYQVVVAGIVLLGTLAATVVVVVLLQRWVVSPVLEMTEMIGRIARLDFEVAIPTQARMVEIGHMAIALEALRRGAMAGEENKAQIVRMARHDPLTGLPNRVALQEHLDQAIAMSARGAKSAVLCLDLDRFKAVNDTFGHPMGDKLLQAVAERLLACVREVDTVSRLGGDEFVVLLVGLELPQHAAGVAQRIVRSMAMPFDLDGQVIRIGSSIGIALMPQDANSAVELLKRADTALYRAKLEEKGSWRFFEPPMDAHLQQRMELEGALRDAVQNAAFHLVYQPQYTLATNQLCGFEALLRWHHPTRGQIGPGDFIPLAEETGLIASIDTWVLRHACQEAVHWPDEVKLAVNLSPTQFKKPAAVQMVRQALAESGLPPTRLVLEITETVLLNNSGIALALLHELHEMGIKIAVDDFGTGYSSLSHLRSFPLDTVKIDRSFIRDLPDQADCRAIVGGLVALCHSLRISTTAEGVETEEQLAELRQANCTEAQGYLFSRPVPAAEARARATSRVWHRAAVT